MGLDIYSLHPASAALPPFWFWSSIRPSSRYDDIISGKAISSSKVFIPWDNNVQNVQV